MMPDEEIELDDDDYVLLRSTISSPPFAARESANTNDDEVMFGVGETMNVDSNWCAYIQAVQTVGDSANTSSIALNESTSKKLVEELTEFWGWEEEGGENNDENENEHSEAVQNYIDIELDSEPPSLGHDDGEDNE